MSFASGEILRRPAGYTWRQILLLAAAGLATGVVLALVVSLPVS